MADAPIPSHIATTPAGARLPCVLDLLRRASAITDADFEHEFVSEEFPASLFRTVHALAVEDLRGFELYF